MRQTEPVNILMVDDQPAKLLSYEAILKELGENLVSASSGREALNHLLTSEFAMILVDVCMPEQDGFELVETIRQHPRFQKIPVIFVSAVQLTDIDKHKGYASGAVDFVAVPVVPVVLRAKVAVFADLFRKTRDLGRLNQELEDRVLSRTEELRKSQDALIEIDKRKDEFIATLAHELRNPLAPMQNSLELLRRLSDSDSDVSAICDTMDRQLRQMTHLIDDLMDVSRITRNKLVLRKSTVPISSIVTSAVEMVQAKITAHGHELVINMPNDDVWIEADAIRMAQALFNLLSNACKYTPTSGQILLDVGTAENQVVMSVTDSGIGIAPEDRERIFQPFYQADRALDRSQGGLGIGLTLVKSIIEKHEGSIEIQGGGEGNGSKFTMKFPLHAKASEDAKELAHLNGKSHESHPRRLLVVDDNHDAAITLTKLLEHLGHDVTTCFDGSEACELVERLELDVIFMDIGMPIMNGYEAARRIRSKPNGKDTTLVALTGWGQEHDRKQTEEAGFDRHLVKPVTLAVLEQVLQFQGPHGTATTTSATGSHAKSL